MPLKRFLLIAGFCLGPPALLQAGTYTYCPSPPFSGVATYYDLAGLVHCSYANSSIATNYYAAIADDMYNSPAGGTCGACAEVTYGANTIVVQVVDECPIPENLPNCANGSNHLDVSRDAFIALAGSLGPGIISITWRFVPCPAATHLQPSSGGNMTYLFKSGSSQWWTQIQIRDHLFPLRSVEYSTSAGGPWSGTTWMTHNYWEASAGMGAGNIYLRITDDRANVVIAGPIVGYNPQELGNTFVPYGQLNVQHPACGPPGSPTNTPTRTRTPSPTRTPTPCVCSPTFTRSPTPVPGDCPLMFNDMESPGSNGTWSGMNATQSWVSSPPAAIAQGSTAMRVDVSNFSWINAELANLTLFAPANWAPYARLTLNVYVDPAAPPWSAGATYHQLELNGSAMSMGKGQQAIAAGAQAITTGMNALSFDLTFPGSINPGDPLDQLWFVLVEDGTPPAPLGTLYFDNLVLHTDTACPAGTPTSTRTPLLSPSNTPTASATPTRSATASASPTRSPTPSRTASPSPSGTRSATPTRTASPSPTGTRSATPTRSSTASPTAAVSPSFTPTRSSTATASPTRTATSTLTLDSSPSFTPTRTASATPSSSSTGTGTPSQTRTSTASPSSTATGTPSSTRTATSTITLGSSPSFTPTRTASATPSSTSTRTGTPSQTRTSTASPSSTATATPSPTRTATSTITLGSSPTFTPTGTASPSSTATPTSSPTRTATSTITLGSSPTFTASSTITSSYTATGTPSATRTATATITLGSSPTFTATGSASATPSSSSTGTGTPSQTLTSTPTPTRSATPDPSGTNTPGPGGSPTFTTTSSATPTPSSAGQGSLSVSPSELAIGAVSQTLTFTFLADTQVFVAGTFTLNIPPAWGLPSLSSSQPTYVSADRGTVSVSGSTVTISNLTMGLYAALTVTFGDRSVGGPGLSAPPAGSYNFNAASDPGGAAPLALAAPAVVTVKAPTATPSLDGPLGVESHAPVPNPNPAFIDVKLRGPADKVELKVYTKALTCIKILQLGEQRFQRCRFYLPYDLISAAPGTYTYRVKAYRSGQASPEPGLGKYQILH